MKKKNIAIITIAVLLVLSYVVLSFTQKNGPKYTTADVVRGEVLQTVSATGTVEAAKKLDLSFINSGKVQEIDIKVGDHIKSGDVLAKLDTSQLESQLVQAKANLNAQNASLNKLLEGATPEDIKVAQVAVDNARISLDNAQQSLTDAKSGASEDISSAQASVNSAQTSLDNYLQSLVNTGIANENNLNKVYENGWDTANSSIITVFSSLDTNKTTLENDDAKDTLSILNIQYLNDSSYSKTIAADSYNNTKSFMDSVRSNLSHDDIDAALAKLETALENTRTTLVDTMNVLQATITSSKLSQTELDTLKANISAAKTNVNTSISAVLAAGQNIQTQKITNQTNLDNAQASVNSAQSSLQSAKQSLASTKAGAETKVNTAQNAVRSAEGALRQAEDQLALKKAGPRAEDVSLYRAQVQEAQGKVDLTQNQIRDSILIAPRDGVITEINGEIGEAAASTKVFVSMITSDDFEIKANVSEVDISKVKIGDEVDITFDALGPDEKFKGKITKIDPAQTEISGVIYYKVTTIFTGDSDVVKPGMTANLDVMTAKKENVIEVPFQALKEKDSQKYVQILENGTAKDVNVEVGLKGDVNVEIVSGLKEGQKVITFTE